MSTTFQFPSIEQREFEEFMKKFKKGSFNAQRLGQAFYNHFNLHRINDQAALKNLYAKDGNHAVNLIRELFHLS